MRLMKFVLMMSLLLFAGVLSVSAQTTEREERSESTPIFVIDRHQGEDCNNNGIDDLDEFFPPECYGKLTSDTGHQNTATLDDTEIDIAWIQCPNGWVADDDGLTCEDLVIDDDD